MNFRDPTGLLCADGTEGDTTTACSGHGGLVPEVTVTGTRDGGGGDDSDFVNVGRDGDPLGIGTGINIFGFGTEEGDCTDPEMCVTVTAHQDKPRTPPPPPGTTPTDQRLRDLERKVGILEGEVRCLKAPDSEFCRVNKSAKHLGYGFIAIGTAVVVVGIVTGPGEGVAVPLGALIFSFGTGTVTTSDILGAIAGCR